MEMKVIGSTHPGFIIDMEDAMSMSAHAAGVCYMKSNINDIINEDIEDTKTPGILVNTYHLYRELGKKIIKAFKFLASQKNIFGQPLFYLMSGTLPPKN